MYCVEYFCVFAGYALAFWQGIKMYNSGQIDGPEEIVTYVTNVPNSETSLSLIRVEFAVIIAGASINYVAPQLTVISKAAAAASELFRIIDKPSPIDPLSDSGLRPDKITGEIEIRDVEFAYPSRPSAPVLRGLTLSVPANKTTALVGASGCDKSTTIGIIERWHQPSPGSILLDGVELSQLDLHWLRTNIRSVH
jgi:ATP-binding cassette, subfamily B (MDR/TAP), member 1